MHHRKSRVIALITAIWLLAVLLVLLAGFAAMVHSSALVARNFGDVTRARWAANSGIHRAEAALLQVVAEPYTELPEEVRVLTSPESETETATANDATYEAVITDEASKININTASVETLRAIFPQEVVEAVIDWRDTDSTPQPLGAEDDYYVALETPYHCRNGAFRTVEELLLVKDITREMLNEPVTDDGLTLLDLLTVSSRDENTDAGGQPRLNVTTAAEAEWTSRFGTELSTEQVKAIIQQRSTTPFRSPADLLNVPQLSREVVAQLYDQLTASTDAERAGLVNLNTAPAVVLAALPEMDEATAQAIIQQRETAGPFTDVGQLLLIESLSNTTFQQVADQLTTRSRTFRVASTGQTTAGLAKTVTCLLQIEEAAGEQIIRTLYWRE